MAQFSFDDYSSRQSNKSATGKKELKVGFFGLKNDGDEAIVRFAYTSPKDFELVTVHTVKVSNGEKDIYKRISCLRENGKEPLDKCPLCSSTDDAIKRVYTKFYVKLVEYVKTEDGHIVPKAKIWERPASFATTLKGYFDEYGPLEDCVFKIKRHGVKGSLETSYDVIPANAMVYKPEIYVKDFTGFDGFKVAGNSYLVKTVDEVKTFLETGEFPFIPKTKETTSTSVGESVVSTPTVSTTPVSSPVTTSVEHADVNGTNSQVADKPRRYTF